LERIERNADGQNDVEHGGRRRIAKLIGHRAKRVDEKVEVFEEAQQPHVEGDADEQQRLPGTRLLGMANPQPDAVVNDRREGNQAQETPIPPSVEDVAGDQAKDQLSPPAQDKEQRQDDRQEDEECQTVKDHEENRS
jgi:hypothetical protein